jgi:beta-glucosidase
LHASIRIALAAATAFLAACSSAPSGTQTAAGNGVAHPDIWPKYKYPVPRDPAVEAQIADLLKRKTHEEKIRQLVQADLCCV